MMRPSVRPPAGSGFHLRVTLVNGRRSWDGGGAEDEGRTRRAEAGAARAWPPRLLSVAHHVSHVPLVPSHTAVMMPFSFFVQKVVWTTLNHFFAPLRLTFRQTMTLSPPCLTAVG